MAVAGQGEIGPSLVAQDDYLLACMRYIELNPVRAGMVEHPGDCRWASYNYNACGRSCGFELKHHDCYRALADNEADRNRSYRQLFDNAIDVNVLHDIRQSLNSYLVLGNERFKDEIEVRLKRKVRHGKAGRPLSRFRRDLA